MWNRNKNYDRFFFVIDYQSFKYSYVSFLIFINKILVIVLYL